ncbi:phage head-tail adapter protein [Oceanobacillus sp. E9]|uniref:phage head closure protein n=1 Tax=Oceanobacillus sp. E9 TaxID=1742575 RepID=UPI00084E5394|nr:phage head closure protein [Oceanobacillus sp. E9]OEH52966.1 phage head-tail adapter protein [Oceanobacillus sp. E9]
MSRTFDHEVTLIKNVTNYDDLGNPIKDEEKTTILCDLKSIGRSEFYNASVQNMKPEIAFVVHAFEYDNQKLVKFDGIRYSVLRTYSDDDEFIELTCERVIGND